MTTAVREADDWNDEFILHLATWQFSAVRFADWIRKQPAVPAINRWASPLRGLVVLESCRRRSLIICLRPKLLHPSAAELRFIGALEWRNCE